MAKYYIYDKDGTRHCTTTETSSISYETGAKLRETILDSGDYTAQLRDTDDGPYWQTKLSIAPMGATRGGR